MRNAILSFSPLFANGMFRTGNIQRSFLLRPNLHVSTCYRHEPRDLEDTLLRLKMSCFFDVPVVFLLARWTLHRCAQGHGTLYPQSSTFNDTLPERYFFAAGIHPLYWFSLEQTSAKVESQSAKKLFGS